MLSQISQGSHERQGGVVFEPRKKEITQTPFLLHILIHSFIHQILIKHPEYGDPMKALVIYCKEHKSTSLGSHGIMTPAGETDNKQINMYLRMSDGSRNKKKNKAG